MASNVAGARGIGRGRVLGDQKGGEVVETLLMGLVSSLTAVLLMLIGFLLNRVFSKLDKLEGTLHEVRELFAVLKTTVERIDK